MKVLKPGKPDLSWPIEFSCPECEAVLEVEYSDIKTYRDYTGDFNGYFIDCPACGAQPEIPDTIQSSGRRWQDAQSRMNQES